MILARQLSKRYRQHRANRSVAIAALDVEIASGSTTAVFGSNGSGKSTLLALLAGQIKSYEGTLNIQGIEAPAHVLQHPVGYATDEPLFHPHLTVHQLLMFVGKLQGLSSGQAAEKTASLTELGLEELLHTPYSALSKGMKQRVNLAQSLVTRSSLIIWDEPTTALDWHYTNQVTNLFHRMKSEGKTVIFSSHDLDLIHQVADTVLHLEKGSIRYCGPVANWGSNVFSHTPPNEAPLVEKISRIRQQQKETGSEDRI